MACIKVSTVNTPGSWDGTADHLWKRTYTRTYQVWFDDKHSGPATIFQGVQDPNTGVKLPVIGNNYFVGGTEQDKGSFVVNLFPKYEASTQLGSKWTVEVKYGPYDATEFPENPIDWPLIMWWGSHKYEKPVEKDINGDPIVNSAQDKFAEPVLIDNSRPVLFVQRNEPVQGFNPLLADDQRDKINTVDWVHGTGANSFFFPQYSVKFSDRTMDKPIKNPVDGTYYYQCIYAFEMDRDKWKVKPLDQGYATLDTSSPPKRRKLTDQEGQPLSEPALLDGNGAELPTNGTAVYLEFDVYEEVDFSVFNMDLSKALGM